jgi:hypothetical protein
MPSSYQVVLWKQESFLVLDSWLLLHDDSCMNESGVEEELTGAEAVRQWFGSWPNFHDAEVISLSLARKGPSVLRVYPYYPHKPATVEFIFENVTDIELQDFSGQNVIMYLRIETATDQNGDKVYRLALGPCYGLAGKIDAKSLRVELSPGKSPDGVSQW